MLINRPPPTRAAELLAEGTPFVQATVVRAQCPTATRPGDSAVILADGSIEGFIGGQCAETSVRLAAADALESGEALLLRILPDDQEDFPESEGAKTVVNPCLSGGAIEVFLEPKLPRARLLIVGNTPIANAIELFGGQLGFAVQRNWKSSNDLDGCTAVLISSHGRHEGETIRAALDAGVGFIGLVASHVRGRAVLAELNLTSTERESIKTPVGLSIGAKTAEEIALSIVAELVQAVRSEGLAATNS